MLQDLNIHSLRLPYHLSLLPETLAQLSAKHLLPKLQLAVERLDHMVHLCSNLMPVELMELSISMLVLAV